MIIIQNHPKITFSSNLKLYSKKPIMRQKYLFQSFIYLFHEGCIENKVNPAKRLD